METNVKAVEPGEPGGAVQGGEGDERARERLVVAYSPLVKCRLLGRMAAGSPSHVDEGDLISYGLIGLIGSIERYDLDRDIKFPRTPRRLPDQGGDHRRAAFVGLGPALGSREGP